MSEITAEQVWQALPLRPESANKGSFGRVLVLAGSSGYRGAAALCTEGALRAGAGLVFLASVEPVLAPVLARTPECCVVPCLEDADGCILPESAAAATARLAGPGTVLLAGPGLGSGAAAILPGLLESEWLGAVLDADALNALAALPVAPRLPPATILTPHPGEAARLLGTTVTAIQADRPAAVRALAAKYHCVAVLKGSSTLVTAPVGGLWRNPTGNPGLARGGSGDVLAGLIAGLLAQGLTPLDAACCGVWLHGTAADRCAQRRGMQTMLPQDLFEDLGTLFAEQGR